MLVASHQRAGAVDQTFRADLHAHAGAAARAGLTDRSRGIILIARARTRAAIVARPDGPGSPRSRRDRIRRTRRARLDGVDVALVQAQRWGIPYTIYG